MMQTETKVAARKAYRKLCVAVTYVQPTRAMRQAAHKAKMASRGRNSCRPAPVGIPASINRHTGKPHEHRREIARRAARQPSQPYLDRE